MVCKFLCLFYNRNTHDIMYYFPILKIFIPHQIKINLKGVFSQNRSILDLNSEGGCFLKQQFKNVHLRHKFSV